MLILVSGIFVFSNVLRFMSFLLVRCVRTETAAFGIRNLAVNVSHDVLRTIIPYIFITALMLHNC